MKHLLRILVVLPLILIVHCSGSSLLDPSLNPNNSNNISNLEVMVLHHRADGTALEPNIDGHKIFANDLGYAIELKEALINWKRLRLISEGSDSECQAGFDQDIPLEYAEDLLGADLHTTALTTVDVPQVAYCQYELTLAPTPGGGVSPKLHAGEEHHGPDPQYGMNASFHLVGTWSKNGQSGEFHLMGSEEVVVSGVFQAKENGVVIDHPLHFHEGEINSHVIFGSKYDQFFQGIDFAHQTEIQQKAKFLDNLPAAVHQHTGDHHGGNDAHP